MKRRFGIRVWLPTAILAAVALLLESCSGYVIELTDDQIQQKLNAKFPIEKTYLLFISVRLFEPRLVLEEGSGRIAFSVKSRVDIALSDIRLEGHGKISGRPRYRPDEGALYLEDPDVMELAFGGLPSIYEQTVAEAFNAAAKEFFGAVPIYRLESSDAKEAMARMVIRDVVVEKGRVLIKLGPGGPPG